MASQSPGLVTNFSDKKTQLLAITAEEPEYEMQLYSFRRTQLLTVITGECNYQNCSYVVQQNPTTARRCRGAQLQLWSPTQEKKQQSQYQNILLSACFSKEKHSTNHFPVLLILSHSRKKPSEYLRGLMKLYPILKTC